MGFSNVLDMIQVVRSSGDPQILFLMLFWGEEIHSTWLDCQLLMAPEQVKISEESQGSLTKTHQRDYLEATRTTCWPQRIWQRKRFPGGTLLNQLTVLDNMDTYGSNLQSSMKKIAGAALLSHDASSGAFVGACELCSI
jgi:hypothetical protein